MEFIFFRLSGDLPFAGSGGGKPESRLRRNLYTGSRIKYGISFAGETNRAKFSGQSRFFHLNMISFHMSVAVAAALKKFPPTPLLSPTLFFSVSGISITIK